MGGGGKLKKHAEAREIVGRKKKYVSKYVKVGLKFPIGRIGRYMKKGKYSERVGTIAPIYLAAVLEYLKVLELAGMLLEIARRIGLYQATLKSDKELGKLFYGVTITKGGVPPNIRPILLRKKAEKAAKEPMSPSKETKSLKKA